MPDPGQLWLPALWWEDCRMQLTRMAAQLPFGGSLGPAVDGQEACAEELCSHPD